MKNVAALLAVLASVITACAIPPTSSPTSTPPASAVTVVSPAPAPVTTEAAAKTCTVPNVVGMVHQNAQDTMQAAGLYMLREQDATGQGRVLALDRNWTTTAQSVAAGQVVDCDTEIMLSAKKIGEGE